MQQVRLAAPLVLVTGLGLGLSSCGGSGPRTTAPASVTPTPSASASATPTPQATPSQDPLSPFESRPPMKVVRSWLAGIGRSINARDRSMAATAPYATGDPARFESYVHDEFGLFYPGPLPFTPVAVRVKGASAAVPGCLQQAGWGQKRATKLPAEKRAIQAVTVRLVKAGSRWRVDRAETRSGSCSGVSVKGVAW